MWLTRLWLLFWRVSQQALWAADETWSAGLATEMICGETRRSGKKKRKSQGSQTEVGDPWHGHLSFQCNHINKAFSVEEVLYNTMVQTAFLKHILYILNVICLGVYMRVSALVLGVWDPCWTPMFLYMSTEGLDNCPGCNCILSRCWRSCHSLCGSRWWNSTP